MQNIYFINISGPDAPGQIARLTKSLSKHQVKILDLNQAVVHEDMSLALLIEIPAQLNQEEPIKDLLYQSNLMGLHLKFNPINQEKMNSWLQVENKKHYIITLLGRELLASQVAKISELVYQNNLEIYYAARLSEKRRILESSLSCLELALRGSPADISHMRACLLQIAQEEQVDIGLQEDTPYRRHRRLIAFDMDSTLIQTEVIDELAERAGAGAEAEVAEVTARAMKGEIDFQQSLRQRVSLLKGLHISVLKKFAHNLPLTEGAKRLINNLQVLGYKIAIISGGFRYFGEHLQNMLGIDYLYANKLEIKENHLTGKLVGEIIDGPKKAELLKELAIKENISLEQVIAVGDGANDLPMLDLAGLGIAFRAKPVVREGAKQAISNVGLDAILYFIGLSDREAMIG